MNWDISSTGPVSEVEQKKPWKQEARARGSCYVLTGPSMEILTRYKTLLIHGHYYNVSVGAEYLKQEARARGFDIVMFGHTHRPFYEVEKKEGDKDLIVLNPGSLSYPRQDGHKPSFMLMEIDKEGEAHFSLNFL